MILKPAALLAAIVSLTFVGLAAAADPVNIEIMAVDEEPGHMTLTVSAVDENGKPFPGLDPSNFNAWINDQALIIKELHTATDRAPASVLLLVDVSSSMAGEPIQQAQAAINEFIDVLEPQDEVAVMTFSHGVDLVQDFTADRDALDGAVANLTLTDDTDLYDGVMQAASTMESVDHSRKLIVLLSDGLANINTDARDSSIQAARDAGISFVAVGLGANTDRQYLSDLTGASGGKLIEAATPAELRAAYTSLAFAIRSQYTIVADVPRSIDRTVAGTLKVHVIHRADNAFAERSLDALPGAFPPPFTMSLSGIEAGDKHNGTVEIVPTIQDGIEVTKIDYYLDDEVVHTTGGVGSYTMDASQLENGSHVLKVIATDVDGREGEVQIPFLVPVLAAPSSGGGSLPIIPILILLLLIPLGYFGYKFGRKRWLVATTPTYSRVDNWASIRMPVGNQKAEEWSDDDPEAEHPLSRSAAAPVEEVIQGRVVIMDEAAVRGGELETIREFEMKSLPLTFGSGPNVDMRVDDAGGLIAAEEARIWVQRGRMVYHKLTTLSAMATEGVTAGWQFLDDGEEMRIGPYRIIFQTNQKETEGTEAAPLPADRLPQEHGMALRRSFGLTDSDRNADTTDPGEASASTGAADADAAPMASSEEPDASPAAEESTASASSWDLPDLTAPDAGSNPGASQWDITPAEPQASSWEIQEDPAPSSSQWDISPPAESSGSTWDAGSSDESAASGEDDPSSQPAEWGPSMLEPKSADWLVEQSQPMESDMGQIVQPDVWSSSFGSGGDEDVSPAGEGDESEGGDESDDQRAWGT
jgi:VWFA-related protein